VTGPAEERDEAAAVLGQRPDLGLKVLVEFFAQLMQDATRAGHRPVPPTGGDGVGDDQAAVFAAGEAACIGGGAERGG
jgi:hypothetical protein